MKKKPFLIIGLVVILFIGIAVIRFCYTGNITSRFTGPVSPDGPIPDALIADLEKYVLILMKEYDVPGADLLVTLTISLRLWRKRSPGLLPMLTLGSLALILESVNMTMGVLNGLGDWSRLREVSVSSVIVILLAVFLLIAGCIWMLQLLSLTGIMPRDSPWHKLAVFLAGMPFLMLCSVIYLTLLWADVYVPTFGGVMLGDGLRVDIGIFLAASTALAVIVTPLHKSLFTWLDGLSRTPAAQVRWQDALIASGLGATMVIIQLAFFNDPTVIVMMK